MTETTIEKQTSFKAYTVIGLALDPIHVGTGGSKLGRVDNTIVRDPVTRIPKIPGSSLAGVTRAYAAMYYENSKPGRKIGDKSKPYYPDCAGQGQEKEKTPGHCGQKDCPICTTFGFAKSKDADGGFAGLAGFSDMQVLLFPVGSQAGPKWVTSTMALQQIGLDVPALEQKIYCEKANGPLNLGWLYLETSTWDKGAEVIDRLEKLKVDKYLRDNICLVSDKLFTHIVNSNLEVRSSVAINPATGAAEEGALFAYEAMSRGTVLAWQVICRDPKHFKINNNPVTAVQSPDDVKNVAEVAGSYLQHLGIGGMGTRGMGRLQVLGYFPEDAKEAK